MPIDLPTLSDVLIIGPYFGRKLFVDKTYQLDAELGLSYVETDFIERDYDDDPVARELSR